MIDNHIEEKVESKKQPKNTWEAKQQPKNPMKAK